MEGNQAKEYREKQKMTHGGFKAQLTREKNKKKSFTDSEVSFKISGSITAFQASYPKFSLLQISSVHNDTGFTFPCELARYKCLTKLCESVFCKKARQTKCKRMQGEEMMSGQRNTGAASSGTPDTGKVEMLQ